MLNKKALAATAAGAEPIFIEDTFSTYLYTGNGSTQTITNGIDLSGEGGLVWTKCRNVAYFNGLTDTVRGAGKVLYSNDSSAQATASSGKDLTSFNSNGFSLGADEQININTNGQRFVSWTFRKAKKFFDVVTYTGNGVDGRAISHNLGSVPGCIILKRTDSSEGWFVYHRSTGNAQTMQLNTTDAAYSTSIWKSTTPSSTTFTVSDYINGNGRTYVAYLFAHDAGGFGDAGDQSVIKCGSYTGDNTGNGAVTLGWEPQWLMVKRTDSTAGWYIIDNMRGFTADGVDTHIQANLDSGEAASGSGVLSPIATGFKLGTSSAGGFNTTGGTYIYIAIRRGPMKTPESGTEVFQPVVSTSTNDVLSTLDKCDMGIFKDAATSSNIFVSDRLRGITSVYNPTLYTNLTNAEATPSTGDTISAHYSTGAGNGKLYFGGAGLSTNKPVGYAFRRSPGFFDMVCWTGNATSGRQISHNLGVTPELMFISTRNNSGGFNIYHQALGATKMMQLSTDGTPLTESWLNDTSPSSTYFTVAGGVNETNASGYTYIAYLFATVTGISKVGSYTGNGSNGLQINCGFTSGARFVMIKRTDSNNDWHVFDSARGIVDGNDPYIKLNSTGAEVTGDDIVDTYSSGFVVNAFNGVNANGGTYIYLAIA